MRKRILVVLAAGVACAIGASLALGAGPSPGLSFGGNGVSKGNVRYVTVLSGKSTLVTKISRQGGRVLRSMTLKGAWGIPLVAFDGTAEGLLADGRTLLLAQSLFSGQTLRKNTTFTLVDVTRMKVRGKIRLQGAYSFDALSPDGRYLYLVEYVSPEDPSLYRVRAYDLNHNKLLAKIVTDKRSWETGMRGSPVTRTRSTAAPSARSSMRSTRRASRRSASSCPGRAHRSGSSTSAFAVMATATSSSPVRTGVRSS